MMHLILRGLQIVALLGVLSSSIYYLLCIWSALNFLRVRAMGALSPASGNLPAVSILKPLKGIDPEIYQCFRSHCLQDYPEYEIVFGVNDPSDPAIDSVRALQKEFPDRAIRLLVTSDILGANVKVSNLVQMTAQARHDFLVINDSDIRVKHDYLRRIMTPLTQGSVGMVTCLYRGVAASTLGSRLESLGISTDFCAGVLVARQLEGGLHFGLGSTLAFRRADLEKAGGFQAILNHLADDYELGKRISSLGLKIELSNVVVETFLPAYSFKEFIAHQLRWARGIRDARAGGYLGLIFTFGIIWAALAFVSSQGAAWSWVVCILILLLRSTVALIVGGRILQDPFVFKNLWLIPVRDLIAAAVWLAGLGGRTVIWRGERFKLKDGKLSRISP